MSEAIENLVKIAHNQGDRIRALENAILHPERSSMIAGCPSEASLSDERTTKRQQ
jgi:hypothetical protein